MNPNIIGISGSPIPNSNTDKAVKRVLESTGLDYEFVKLSELNIRPCRACRQCVTDNICKQIDDFPKLAEKVRTAKGLVIGAYTPYSQIDAYTKAFLERLWSLRHLKNLLMGKPVVIIVTGCHPKMLENPILRYTGLSKIVKPLKFPPEKVKNAISLEMTMEQMNVIGQVIIKGNVPCLTCGYGNECKMSGVPFLYGKNVRASAEKCFKVENQKDAWKELQSLGTLLGKEAKKSSIKHKI